MKQFILAIMLTWMGFTSVKAQQWHYGIKGGLNLSNLHSSNTPIENLVKTRTGLHIGAFTEYSFGSVFSLQLEALYSQQGSKMENNYIEIEPPGPLGKYQNKQREGSGAVATTGKYDYLNLPLLAKAYIYEGFNIFAGPQLSVLLSAKDKMGDVELDVKEDLDPVDFGLLSGAGYQFDFGLFLSASYYWGLNNISAYNTENLVGFNVDIHQGMFQFSTGYRF